MGIDVEDIKLCVCRIVQFSLRVAHRFVQKHPRVSATLSFLFILYIFFPSVLRFLFYSLPFIGFAAILLAFWISKRPTNEGKTEDKPKSSEHVDLVNRNRRPYLRNVASRRQRFTDKSGVWSAEASIDASVGRTDQSVECDNLKAFIDYGNNASASDLSTSVDKNIEISGRNHPILGSEVLVKSDLLGCDFSGSQTNKSDSGGDETKVESSEEAEDEDEEETQEDTDKAVEWTENDQKNLMDLGLSEIERNRRLESLIARRRARKSHKRKVEGVHVTIDVVPPGQIPKIVTIRKDPFDASSTSKEMDGAPGSAPSVLLPMRNPFDLPYDPLEEKPDLMADSFQQEFTAVHQKEVSYCRHESFCLGHAFALGDEGGGLGYPRFRRPSDKGDHDWLIEQLLLNGDQASHAEKKHSVDSLQIEDDKGTTTTLNTTNVNGKEMENVQGKNIFPDTQSEFETKSQLIQDTNGESSPSFSSENPEDVMSVNGAVVSRNFESTLSNALSKMVCHTPAYSIASDLQVEVSEMGSPQNDGESLHHDWEIENEMNSGGEELQGNSSDQLEVKEEELESRDVREANEEDNNVKLLGTDMNSENPASSEHLKYKHEQDDLNSLSGEVPYEVISHLQEVNLAEVKASSGPDAPAPETVQITMHLIKELADHTPQDILPQKPEELSSPPDTNGEVINGLIEQKEADAKVPSGYQDDLDHLQSQEGSNKLNQIADNMDLVEPGVHGSTMRFIPSETKEQMEFIKDDKNEVNVVESEMQNSIDAVNSSTDQNSVTEEAVLDANSRLNPISAIEEQVNVDQFSSSNSNDMICADASKCSSSKPDLPLTVQELEDTTTQPTNNSQEPSMTVKAYKEEARSINNLVESIVDGKTDEENSEHNEATERESEISIINEDHIISPQKPVEESNLSNKDQKIFENDDNKPVALIDVENEIIKDLSEKNGDESNLDAVNDYKNTDNNSNTPKPTPNIDTSISENVVEREVVTEEQIDTEQAPVSVTTENIKSVENSEGDENTEGNSKYLNENEAVVSPSKGGEISNSKLVKNNEDEGAMETEKKV